MTGVASGAAPEPAPEEVEGPEGAEASNSRPRWYRRRPSQDTLWSGLSVARHTLSSVVLRMACLRSLHGMLDPCKRVQRESSSVSSFGIVCRGIARAILSMFWTLFGPFGAMFGLVSGFTSLVFNEPSNMGPTMAKRCSESGPVHSQRTLNLFGTCFQLFVRGPVDLGRQATAHARLEDSPSSPQHPHPPILALGTPHTGGPWTVDADTTGVRYLPARRILRLRRTSTWPTTSSARRSRSLSGRSPTSRARRLTAATRRRRSTRRMSTCTGR